MGPTGIGKTELITEQFQDRGEVINGDSIQIYKELSIGSAKPTFSERAKIPFHLVDFLSIKEGFSVGEFVRSADNLITEIQKRGKTPILSAGTIFYIKGFLYGLPPIPPTDLAIREELNQKKEQQGLSSLWEELKKVDPARAQTLSSNDSQRIVRSLEVFYSTGKPISSFKESEVIRIKESFKIITLTMPREKLYSRINKRVDKMVKMGLTDEWQNLLEKGFTGDEMGLKAIGYREFFEAKKRGNFKLDSVVEEIKRNSRRYAKRQITFLNKIPAERVEREHFLERNLFNL